MQDREWPAGLDNVERAETSGGTGGSFAPVPEATFDACMSTAGLTFEGEQRNRIHRDTRYVQMMRASIWDERLCGSSAEGSQA